ncbi:MAG: protein phosphatase 2C domain-containing protein [Alphaproteobacteria bacterium]|nr:protein phosphatase 2C domain-containing protein [Alphaproteobacteria bacterium]
MILDTHCFSAIGARTANDDAFATAKGAGYMLMALADGLGGHRGGGVAAGTAVQSIGRAFGERPDLGDESLAASVRCADEAVAAERARLGAHSSFHRTTLAFVACSNGNARWGHVGDTRIYFFRAGAQVLRTRDHSVSELTQSLPAALSPEPGDVTDSHRLLRVLGAGDGAALELAPHAVALQNGDAFLLCTDGVWSALSDEDFAAALAASSSAAEWGGRIRAAIEAQKRKDQDNYTAITAVYRTGAEANGMDKHGALSDGHQTLQ